MHGDRKLCIRTLPPGCCIEELRKRTLRESSLPSWGEMRTEGTVVHLGRGSRPVDSPSAGSRARASQRRVSECAKPHPAEEGARARRSNSLRAAGSSSRPRPLDRSRSSKSRQRVVADPQQARQGIPPDARDLCELEADGGESGARGTRVKWPPAIGRPPARPPCAHGTLPRALPPAPVCV